jgi:ubiquinone/menaquinone biosynthesis C-methylase UbiE
VILVNVFTALAPFYNVIFAGMQKKQGKKLLNRLSPLEGKKVLDLGGGTGRFAAQMSSAGADVWLLDNSQQMINQAVRVLPSERVISGNAANLPFSDNIFDIITLVDVFHHIRNQEETVNECYRILIPGGCLCFLDFSPNALSIRVLARLERLLGEPSLFLSPDELAELLGKAGYVNIETDIFAREYILQARKQD